MITPEHAPRIIAHYFPLVRATSKRIAGLEESITECDKMRDRAHSKYRDELDRIAARVRAIRSRINTEECILRRRISRALKAGRDPLKISSNLDPKVVEEIANNSDEQ